MSNLEQTIRAFALTVSSVSAGLSTYLDTKAIFTRYPAPSDAVYPLAMVSTLLSDTDDDTVSDVIRTLTHQIAFYGENDTAAKYRLIETMAEDTYAAFNRADRMAFTSVPSGWEIIECKASSPRAGAVDDDKTVGRVVPLRFLVKQG